MPTDGACWCPLVTRIASTSFSTASSCRTGLPSRPFRLPTRMSTQSISTWSDPMECRHYEVESLGHAGRDDHENGTQAIRPRPAVARRLCRGLRSGGIVAGCCGPGSIPPVDFGPYRDVRLVLPDVRAPAVDFLFVRSRVFAAVSRGDPGEDPSLLSAVACAARSDRGREIHGGRFRTRADFLNEYNPDEHTDIHAQLRGDEILFRGPRDGLSRALRSRH